jgi:Holliday junction resolvasome RuvABC endonuclease subunit
MMKIGGLDYSMTNSGIAILTRRVTGECVMHTTTVRSTGHRGDSLPVRRQRLATLAADVVHHLGTCDLVVIEGVIRGATGALLDRYGGLWFIMDPLIRREVPIAVAGPGSAKKAITDNGRADKALMSRYITKLWPDLETANEHESDAAGLAHLGAVALGWNVSTLERHKAVKWTEWPEFGPTAHLVALPMDYAEEVS